MTQFAYTAGLPALDLLNTASGVGADRTEQLASFDDVVAWLKGTGALEGVRAPSGTARERADAYAGAIRLREWLRGVSDAIAESGTAPASARRFLNAQLAAGRWVLESRADRGLVPVPVAEGPGDVVPVLAAIAADLLSADPARVRRCENRAQCTMFFLDATKNASRAWCSMRTCGNRAKTAAYRRRHAAA